MVQVPQGIRDSLETAQLPAIPQILLRFIALTEDDSVSVNELAELVGQDPALAARVLTVANSVAFRRGKATTSLVQCLVTLGTRLSRTLASCLIIQKVFTPTSVTSRYDLNNFWMHVLQVADISRVLAAQQHYRDCEEAYLAGLLHDIGQLLLLGALDDRYGNILASSSDENMLRVFEGQRLGTDHTVIGAWMVDRWELTDSFLADAILFHHASAEDIRFADPLSQIVWTAHLICQHARLYQQEQQIVVPPDFEISDLLFGINFERAAGIYQQATKNVTLLAQALGIHSTPEGRMLPMPMRTTPAEDIPRLAEQEKAPNPSEEIVWGMALMKPLQQDLVAVQSESELYLAAQESARILFGVGSVAFLTLNSDEQVLSGLISDYQPQLLQRIRIPIDSGNSLATATFVDGTVSFTLNHEAPRVVSLVDVQIARILGTEGLIYVPLLVGNKSIGVMVCAVSALHAARLLKRIPWMLSFARAAASGIDAWHKLNRKTITTEQHQRQKFVQHARKIAHEAANPLGIIKNYLSIVTQRLPADIPVLQELDVMKEEIDRITQILSSLTLFSEALQERQLLSINYLVETMLVLYRESLFESRGITVQLELDNDIPTLQVDRDKLKQIFFNLWNNAAEALPEGGALTIATRTVYMREGASSVELVLSDNGPGLPADVLASLFVPLDHQRRQGHAGMGLSIVADLVRQLDGQITCHSKPGYGTTFTITLPVRQGAL